MAKMMINLNGSGSKTPCEMVEIDPETGKFQLLSFEFRLEVSLPHAKVFGEAWDGDAPLATGLKLADNVWQFENNGVIIEDKNPYAAAVKILIATL